MHLLRSHSEESVLDKLCEIVANRTLLNARAECTGGAEAQTPTSKSNMSGCTSTVASTIHRFFRIFMSGLPCASNNTSSWRSWWRKVNNSAIAGANAVKVRGVCFGLIPFALCI